MKQIWTGPVSRAAAQYGETAPMAVVCCNACRACVTTNVVGIVTAAFAGAGFTVANVVRRRLRRA